MKIRCQHTIVFDPFDGDDPTPEVLALIEKEGLPVQVTIRALNGETIQASGRLTPGTQTYSPDFV